MKCQTTVGFLQVVIHNIIPKGQKFSRAEVFAEQVSVEFIFIISTSFGYR